MCNTLDVFLTSNAGIFSVWQAWKKTVYSSQSLIKYLTCLIIEAHDSPRAVRYVGVLGVRDKREVWCLAWKNHLCYWQKKEASRIKRSLSFCGALCAQVGSFYNIMNFKASCITRAIIRHDPIPVIISNRLLTPH